MKHPVQFIMAGAALCLVAGCGLFITGIAGGGTAVKRAGCMVVLAGGGIAAIPLITAMVFDVAARIGSRKQRD